jgi:hypothetical protein
MACSKVTLLLVVDVESFVLLSLSASMQMSKLSKEMSKSNPSNLILCFLGHWNRINGDGFNIVIT